MEALPWLFQSSSNYHLSFCHLALGKLSLSQTPCFDSQESVVLAEKADAVGCYSPVAEVRLGLPSSREDGDVYLLPTRLMSVMLFAIPVSNHPLPLRSPWKGLSKAGMPPEVPV